jgi:hypothetical protein
LFNVPSQDNSGTFYLGNLVFI